MIVCQYPTAVVVLSYNGKDLHNLFFPLLIEESKGLYDVVLIDNASTDDTATFVANNFPSVHIVHVKVNKGFANGYYEGLQQIQASYYVLLSADFEVTPGWFTPMFSLIQHNPDITAIQPKIKYYKEKTKFEYAGAGGGFIDRWGYLFCRGRIFFTIEDDNGQYDNTIEVFWAGGGCMLVNASVYHQLGGLDRDLYAHMEEVDLCWRMKNAGYRIAYCGQSTVYHIGGSVISYGSPQKIFYNYRNSLVLLLKNLPTSKVWWMLPWRMILDGISAVRALVKGDIKEIKAIWKAHMSFYSSLRMWLNKRSEAKLWVTHRNTRAMYKGSIIVDYFVRKKQIYSQLSIQETPIS